MIFGSHWPDYRVRGLCAIMRPMRVAISALILALAIGAAAKGPDPLALDKAGERWVDATLKKMTLDQKVGQLLVPSFESTFLPSDSDGYEALAKLVHEAHVGGFHVFGGSEPAPQVLLNPTYGTVTLGQGLAAASVLNRLQAISPVPLLNTADFEAGVGFRIAGATLFPRAMAFGAAGDERLAHEAGRITAIETRALGIHVNFAPVVDVNNNARNPVINTRSFGEDPAKVGALASAYVRGLQAERRLRGAQALSRSRRHRRRFASRPADHSQHARAPGRGRAAAVPGRHRRRRAGDHDGPHRDARARSDEGHSDDAESADRVGHAAGRDRVPRPRLHRLDADAGRHCAIHSG